MTCVPPTPDIRLPGKSRDCVNEEGNSLFNGKTAICREHSYPAWALRDTQEAEEFERNWPLRPVVLRSYDAMSKV
jgi:hypothetical protein